MLVLADLNLFFFAILDYCSCGRNKMLAIYHPNRHNINRSISHNITGMQMHYICNKTNASTELRGTLQT